MILIELTGAVNATGAERTFYLASDAFTTSGADSPPDTEFANRLKDPGAIAFSIFGSGGESLFGGGAKLDLGEIVAVNDDGEFDALKDYSFDGRPFIMRWGEAGAGPYPFAYTPILSGTVAYVTVSWAECVIAVRDATFIFDKPVQTRRFLGTNLLPNGLEGTADDIKGQIVPKVFGRVFSRAVPCVNTSQLIYRVNDGKVDDIPAVYVRGGAQTRSVDYATSALLMANTVAFGSYATCLAEGLFKLGGADGLVTADIVEGGSERSAARLLRRLALAAGVPAANINVGDVNDLHTLNPAELGLYVDDETTTFTDAMDAIARTVGAWYTFEPLGALRMGRLDGPTGVSAVTLEEYQILKDGFERTTLQDQPTPVWSVTLNHTFIGQTQTTDLVGSVTSARRAFLEQEFRSVTATNAGVLTQFRLAENLTVDTLFTTAADAQAEAARVLALRDQPQDVFDVPLDMSEAQAVFAKGVWLGSEIGLRLADSGRFGLAAGKTFILIGLRYERKAKRVTFELWGHGADIVVGPQTVEAFGIATAVAQARATGQNATGRVPAVGAAQGAGVASGVGSTVGGQPAGGTLTGLLAAITAPVPTGPSGAGSAHGAATVTGRSIGTAAGAGSASGTGAASGNGATVGGGGTAGQPAGLLLIITKAS